MHVVTCAYKFGIINPQRMRWGYSSHMRVCLPVTYWL